MARIREYIPANYRYHEENTWYAGVIIGIEDDEMSHGPVVKFVIDLVDDDGDREVHAIATDRLTPRSKLTGWIKELFGEDAVGEGKSVDLDEVIAMRVEVMFAHGENQAGEPNESVSHLRPASQPEKSREPTEEQLTAPF